MKPLLFLIVAFAVAGCASPRENCLRQATRDLSIVRALISDSEATLERGYAIQTETRTVLYTDFCLGTGRNHGTFRFCTRAQPVSSRVPVAVDLDAERAKLRSLRRKEVELRRKSADAAQRCTLEHATKS